MTTQEMQNLLFANIPITNEMGITVESMSSDNFILSVQLSPNRNHKGTVFGGSQYAAAALASYGLFFYALQERGFATQNIVIGEGKISYHKPISTDFKVKASWTQEAQNKFFATLQKKQKAKVEIFAELGTNNQPASLFQGIFVCHLS